ncbi:hypothetical protein LXL04_002886 [Taraxacum kok-saghyz]
MNIKEIEEGVGVRQKDVILATNLLFLNHLQDSNKLTTGVFDFARTRTRTQTTDHGPSPTSNSPIKCLGPRTESDITGKKLSLRFLYTDRVRGKTSDHGPSLTSNPRYQTLGPRTESVKVVRGSKCSVSVLNKP